MSNNNEIQSELERENPVTIPFMSVVIPAFNCRNEIERLLDSIVVQNWSKDELEVIICDDNSTDNFMELVEPYYDKLTIKYYKTQDRDVHCPGNTRKDGLSHVTGEWVTFIDNDDMFEDGAFNMIRNHIKVTGESRMVFTIFREYTDEKLIDRSKTPNARSGFGKDFDGGTWLHGNWYNVKWLRDSNIDFKENLESHEDLYFNSLCDITLRGEGVYYSIPVENELPGDKRKYAYRWMFRPNSLSRGYYNETHYYIEVYLRDYIYAATQPFMQGVNLYCKDGENPELMGFCMNQCIYAILYSFFYYESAYYRLRDKVLPENINYIRDIVDQVCFRFKITRSDIINIVYSNPISYQNVKSASFNGGGVFVELHTFRDFIFSL